jgi:hypothetical protein
MKNISETQRELNILNKAISLGFEFDRTEIFEDIFNSASKFLIDKSEAIEEFCEVKNLGRDQRVDYYDGMGYEFWSQGEIWNHHSIRGLSEGDKFYHTTVIDSEGQVIKLFFIVE